MRVRPGVRVVLASLLVCPVLACGSVDRSDSDVSNEELAADSIPEAVLLEPEVPTVAGEGESRLYRILLVNALEGDAHVFATAGAERVALDTVPGQDSLHVDIRVRAVSVDLEAEDESGRSLKRETLELMVDSVTRWVITPPIVSLVTDLERNYARLRSSRPAKRR